MAALSGQEHDSQEWFNRHNIPFTVEWHRLHDNYYGKDKKMVEAAEVNGVRDLVLDAKLSADVENYDALAEMARHCGLYQQFIECVRTVYLMGQESALAKFKGAEVFDPSVAERECQKPAGISALPNERSREDGND